MAFFMSKKRASAMIEEAVSKATENAVTIAKSWEQEQKNLLEWLGLSDVREDTLSEATYFACLKVLSESIGKLPLKLQRYTPEDGVMSVRNDPLWFVLHDRPNPYMSSAVFWSTVELNRNHYGNAFVWIDGYGKDLKLWPLPNNQVTVWYDNSRKLADTEDIYYVYDAPDRRYYFKSEEILHFRTSNSLDGITGIAVQDQLRATIRSGQKSQTVMNDLYDSGMTAKAVLQYTSNLSDENAKAFVKGIEDYATGKMSREGVRNILPIPLGATLTPLNIKLTDSQFVELKQYTALQIASAFGIRPYQIGDYTKSSYASAEAQQLSFLVDTLLYILKHYEEEITYKLIPREKINSGYDVKFNVDVILRADFATKVQTLSTAVNSFLMTPNEAREKLDLPHKPGGDRLLGNGASIPVEYTGSQYTDGLVTD